MSYPIHASRPDHLIPLYLIIIIIIIILAKGYKLQSSSLLNFLQSPYHFNPPWSKYSPRHLDLKQPQSIFLPQCQRPSSAPIQNTGKIITLYIPMFMLSDSRWEEMLLDWLIVRVARIQSPLNFLLNLIFICYCHTQILELCHILKVLAVLMSWFCLEFCDKKATNSSVLCIYF
jgi:hypothetical protein